MLKAVALGKSMMKIESIPMPPSVNAIYFTRGKNRVLTTLGKTYKEDVKAIIIQHIMSTQQVEEFKNIPMILHLTFYFSQIENKNYQKSGNRFKRIDVSNRIKILEDAISETIGVDDCQFLCVIAEKGQGDTETVTMEIYHANSI
jgi:Holliday junction resolvase RusA-like endonuclease